MKMILAFLLVSCAVVPLSLFADERADVFKELGVLKKDYRKRISEIRKAGNDELKTDGFKLKEIQDLQAASVAQRKKVEALQYRLVADSGDEGKVLIEKIKSLEARYEELRK